MKPRLLLLLLLAAVPCRAQVLAQVPATPLPGCGLLLTLGGLRGLCRPLGGGRLKP